MNDNHTDISPPEVRGLHRALVVVSSFFFIYLVVEGALIMPWFISRYGWH